MKGKRLLTVVILVFMAAAMLTGCKKPPEPTVKEGKFDFSVTYEMDGVVETISGVFGCEFKEAGRGITGYYIRWHEYIETKEVVDRLVEDSFYMVLKTTDDGIIYLDLNLHVQYFMSDPNCDQGQVYNPYVYIMYSDEAEERYGANGSDDPAVLEGYGVKIIAFECDAPIENQYK